MDFNTYITGLKRIFPSLEEFAEHIAEFGSIDPVEVYNDELRFESDIPEEYHRQLPDIRKLIAFTNIDEVSLMPIHFNRGFLNEYTSRGYRFASIENKGELYLDGHRVIYEDSRDQSVETTDEVTFLMFLVYYLEVYFRVVVLKTASKEIFVHDRYEKYRKLDIFNELWEDI